MLEKVDLLKQQASELYTALMNCLTGYRFAPECDEAWGREVAENFVKNPATPRLYELSDIQKTHARIIELLLQNQRYPGVQHVIADAALLMHVIRFGRPPTPPVGLVAAATAESDQPQFSGAETQKEQASNGLQ